MGREFIEGRDYYVENGVVVMTAHFHMQRGFCCGKDCKECPFIPVGVKGNRELMEKYKSKNLDDI